MLHQVCHPMCVEPRGLPADGMPHSGVCCQEMVLLMADGPCLRAVCCVRLLCPIQRS